MSATCWRWFERARVTTRDTLARRFTLTIPDSQHWVPVNRHTVSISPTSLDMTSRGGVSWLVVILVRQPDEHRSSTLHSVKWVIWISVLRLSALTSSSVDLLLNGAGVAWLALAANPIRMMTM